jgi:hypothetical protein
MKTLVNFFAGVVRRRGEARVFSHALAVGAATMVAAFQVSAVITPAPNRSFCTNVVTGADIIAQMGREAANPLINQTVVRLINSAPVDVNNDGNPDFFEWTGTLITPEWVLTCAHALEGIDGRGAGVLAANLECVTDDLQVFAVAEFRIHPSWQTENYLGGNDIALVRLANPVNGAGTFPRLSATGFAQGVATVFAGYGQQGNGDVGGTGFGGSLAVGVNTFDLVGSGMTTNGAGAQWTPFPGVPASVAFMDFDKWQSVQFACPAGTNIAVPLALTNFSTMSSDHVIRPAALPACPGSLSITSEFRNAAVCDFFPGDADSGGPAFLWPTAPAIPAAGYYLTGTPTLYALMSFATPGTAPTPDGLYGNVAGFTLVEPHLDWIYDQVPGIANADNDGDGKTNRQELDDGTDPYDPASVSHDPGVAPGTWVPNPIEVILRGMRIIRETVIGANETEVEFTADLENTESGRYSSLSANIVASNLPPFSTVLDPILEYPTLSELGTAVAGAGQTLVIRTFNTNLAQLRTVILSGAILQVNGYEEQVYAGPTKFIDQPTDDAFEGTTFNGSGELVLILSHGTALSSNLQAGDILVADASPGGYTPKERSPTDPFFIPYLGQQIPFEVVSVSVVDGKTHVAGHKRQLNQVLKSGTFAVNDDRAFRDLLDPSVENTYTEEEKEARLEQCLILSETDPSNAALTDLCGMNAIPWQFNDVEITKFLKLSGQVLMRSSGLRFQVTFRDFAIKRASVGIDAGLVASMVLETTGTNNNVSVPLLDKQKTLASIPLHPPPGIPITIAGVPCFISVGFTLSVGAEANAPGGLSIPLETSATIGAEIGWADGQTFATPIKQFIAPHVSDPTVFDAVEANAKAWVEARLDVGVSVGGIATAGPSLAVRANASFEVEPFNNPWWSLDAGADLVGAFRLNLLGFNVAGADTVVPIANFFHKDAGGPLIPPFAPAATLKSRKSSHEGTNTLTPFAGENVRWALAFAASNSAGAAYSKGFVEPLSGGGFMVGGGAAIPSFLGVVSADGHMLWSQHFPHGAKPVDAIQMPDGSVIVVGTAGFDWWIASYDTNGNRAWVKSHRMSADLRDLEIGTAANGDPEFYLAGYYSPVIITQSDPVVLKLDKDGNVIWTKFYTRNFDDEVYALRALSDGNFLLVGRTDARVGTDLFIGARNNGFVAKMTPSGDLLWANAIASRWGLLLRDAAEGPDGSLYVAGSGGDIVTDYYPSIFVGKFTSGGELLNHVLLGEDPDRDVVPSVGDTAYDTATQAVWTENGLVVVGNTGLGTSEAAWAATFTEELGVRWFTMFDGPSTTVFEDVAVTEHGIAALGFASEVWSGKFTGRSPAWLVSLPWEGVMRFHPNSGVRSSYVQPRVFLSSGHGDFLGRITDGFGNLHAFPTAPVSFVITNGAPAAGGNINAGAFATFETARLDRIEPTIIDTCDEWIAYWQLTGTNSVATADPDRDGLVNQLESYFGRNPLQAETTPVLLISRGETNGQMTVTIQYDRASADFCSVVDFEFSSDLQLWQPPSGFTETVEGTGPTTQRVRLTTPATLLTRFYRPVAR